MNSKKAVIIIVVLVLTLGVLYLIFSGGSGSQSNDTGSTQKEKVESNKVSFALADYDGNIVDLSDFNGKIVVANAWATWCPFCVNELPEFEKLQEAFQEDISVVAINRAEPTGVAKEFSDNLGLSESYTFLIDPKDSFYKSIGGFAMPETVFLSPKGEILMHKKGPFDFAEMKEIVDKILAE